jgi:hypothetical protein
MEGCVWCPPPYFFAGDAAPGGTTGGGVANRNTVDAVWVIADSETSAGCDGPTTEGVRRPESLSMSAFQYFLDREPSTRSERTIFRLTYA